MRQVRYWLLVLSLQLTTASLFADDISLELEGFQQIECEIQERVCNCQLKAIGYELNSSNHITFPHIPVAESISSNWSGYAALTSLTKPANDVVTNVSGRWTVPALSSTPGQSYSSIWVGIDGYASTTVEQIGTEHDFSAGVQKNYAWFEMYPNGAYEILGFPLNVNDQIGAQVAYQGNNTFVLTLTNYTRKVFTSVPTSYTMSTTAKRSSAEWVVEAPYLNGVLPLADFGVETFSNCSATIRGFAGPINSNYWVYDPLSMGSDASNLKALPSNLTATGQGFTVTWKHE